MSPAFPHSTPLDDLDLIVAVQRTAAVAEAEIEAAFRFREGSAVRDWHLERADTATVELLGLINGPQYRAVWERIEAFIGPDEQDARRRAAQFILGGECAA